MNYTNEQIRDVALQIRRHPFRPFRLVFRTPEGPRTYEFHERNQMLFLWGPGRFMLPSPESGSVHRHARDLLLMGYIDELDGGAEPGPDGLRHAS